MQQTLRLSLVFASNTCAVAVRLATDHQMMEPAELTPPRLQDSKIPTHNSVFSSSPFAVRCFLGLELLDTSLKSEPMTWKVQTHAFHVPTTLHRIVPGSGYLDPKPVTATATTWTTRTYLSRCFAPVSCLRFSRSAFLASLLSGATVSV